MVKRFGLSIIIVSLLVSSSTISVVSSENQLVLLYGNKILYVGGSGPGNYTRIQDAIENASKGDTIFVFEGIYPENVNVNKYVNLIGEEKNNTVIDGRGRNYTVQILVDDVYITNLSIINATDLFWPDPWEQGALRICHSRNVTIKNNLFSNNFIGICIYKSSKCVLRDNMMSGCNIALWGDDLSSYIHDIDNNFANEKPILYYKNCNDISVSGNIGEVFFVNCTNCSVSNTIITNVTNGIQVCYSKNMLIENTTISDINSTGIHFDHSENNMIRNNVFLHHKHLDFIFLDCSKNNIFEYNIVNGDAVAITLMHNSNNNRFFKNDFSSKNVQSMIIDSSNWNEIIYNNINGSCLKKILKGKTLGVSGDVLLSRGAFFNKFDKNYWRGWIGNGKSLIKFFPKMILGVGSAIVEPHTFPVFVDFDWHPAKEPYEIL